MSLNKIRLSKYAKLADRSQYEAVLKYQKPINRFGTGRISFDRLSYKDVQKCIKLIKAGKSFEQLKELFCIAYGVTDKVFWKVEVTEYFAAQNYLIKAFFDLQQRESKLLKSDSADSALWQMAGGDRLNKYSPIMPLMQLGEIYKIWPYELQDKPYNEVFILLLANKEKSEVQKDFNTLKQKQSK